MTQQHPITPPPELVQQWIREKDGLELVVARAAQWGADTELEACCEVLDSLNDGYWSKELLVRRRPKPPSLKQQALEGLTRIESTGEFFSDGMKDLKTIRRALEQLDD